MAGALHAAKPVRCSEFQRRPASATAAQARIGLERIDDREEIVEPDDTLELKAGAYVARPDAIGFDPSDHREPDDDAVATGKLMGVIDHEAVRREITDVKVEIAVNEMLYDCGKVYRVAGCPAHVRNTKIRSRRHGVDPSITLLQGQQLLENG
jgi:hypothetical protein